MTWPFFSDFSLAEIIFYFSKKSTLTYVAKTHSIHSRGRSSRNITYLMTCDFFSDFSMANSIFLFFKYINSCYSCGDSPLFTPGGEEAGISIFQQHCRFSVIFCVTNCIFYFSNISTPVTVVITHPYSPQGVTRQEFQIFKNIVICI
jgi:hypothetical protein